MKNFDALDHRLRADADAFRPTPPSAMRGRIQAAIRANAAAVDRHDAVRPPSTLSAGRARAQWDSFAAAAALLLAIGAFWFDEPRERPERERPVVLERLNDLLEFNGAALVVLGEEPLRTEAANVMGDASRAMQGFVSSLPSPFKKRFGAQ